MNRKALARTSAKPGKTQTINFYNINEEMYLVDLPGYGYAKVSEQEKAQWGKLIERYLHGSKQLRAVFLLIDIRHDPSANDKMMYDWIVDQGFNPIIIATKLDKLKRSQVQKQVKAIKTGLKLLPGTVVIRFQQRQKQGRDEIWNLGRHRILITERRNNLEKIHCIISFRIMIVDRRPCKNAISYLFQEEIPPEILRNIMLYCLDCYSGGSCRKVALPVRQ